LDAWRAAPRNDAAARMTARVPRPRFFTTDGSSSSSSSSLSSSSPETPPFRFFPGSRGVDWSGGGNAVTG